MKMINKIKQEFFNKNFIKFGIIGVINTINYNLLYILGLLVFNYMISNIIAYVISLIISFLLNCKYNFKVKPTLKKLLLFPLSGLATFLCQTIGLYLLVDLFNCSEYISAFISSLAAIPITFVIVKFILKK